MAETAYERFLKDVKDDEAVDIEIRDPKPLDLDQVKLRIQNELANCRDYDGWCTKHNWY